MKNYKDAFGLSLLRNTIIVDTVNLSKTAKKATPQDESALQKIESILDLNDTSRQTMLDEITAAKNSIEGFTPDQLMRKDLKIIPIMEDTLAAVPSIVMLVKNICKMDDSMDKVFDLFCKKYECPMLILLGMQNCRDIGIYLPEEQAKLKPVVTKIIETLCGHSDLGVNESLELAHIPRLHYLTQGNIAYSRKKLLPIIIECLKD